MKNKIILVVIILVFILLLVYANKTVNNKVPELKDNSINSVDNKSLQSSTSELQTKTNTAKENNVTQVNSENFDTEVLNSDKKVLIDFYANWCVPCKHLSPIVEEVAKENSDIKFVKINVDENEDLAEKYGIMYLPTLVVIENGEIINQSIGYIEKEEVEKLIK